MRARLYWFVIQFPFDFRRRRFIPHPIFVCILRLVFLLDLLLLLYHSIWSFSLWDNPSTLLLKSILIWLHQRPVIWNLLHVYNTGYLRFCSKIKRKFWPILLKSVVFDTMALGMEFSCAFYRQDVLGEGWCFTYSDLFIKMDLIISAFNFYLLNLILLFLSLLLINSLHNVHLLLSFLNFTYLFLKLISFLLFYGFLFHFSL